MGECFWCTPWADHKQEWSQTNMFLCTCALIQGRVLPMNLAITYMYIDSIMKMSCLRLHLLLSPSCNYMYMYIELSETCSAIETGYDNDYREKCPFHLVMTLPAVAVAASLLITSNVTCRTRSTLWLNTHSQTHSPWLFFAIATMTPTCSRKRRELISRYIYAFCWKFVTWILEDCSELL